MKKPTMRQAFMFVLIPAAVIAMVVAIVWFLVLPQYRPALKQGEVYGIDVSAHQESLDWEKVAADDIRFVYIKATEGSSYEDERFKAHYDGARKAGLRIGAYHYFSLCSPGKSQAESFIKAVPDDQNMLPPVLDLEFSPFCQNEPDRGQVMKEVNDYLGIVAAASGKKPIIYVGDDFDRTYQIKEHYRDYKYWQLRYMQRPGDSRDYIWQVGYFFKVNGAPGKVDLNLGRIDGL